MRVIIQRVKSASVSINHKVCGSINQGILLLVGFTHTDAITDYEWIINKILNLRVFNDSNNIMNLSLIDVKGELLVISQFTLFANAAKGNRPSYIKASKPVEAKQQYQSFLSLLKSKTNLNIQQGEFGANMQIELINDGPVTIVLDSQQKEG